MVAMIAENVALHKKGLKRVICAEGSQVTISQMVRILEKYLRDNPQYLHEKASLIAMAAFSGAFPCKE
jgi:hypothetical protein